MFLALFVIQQGFAVDALFQMLLGYMNFLAVFLTVEYDHFQRIQRRSGVAVGKVGDHPQQIIVEIDLIIAKTPRIL